MARRNRRHVGRVRPDPAADQILDDPTSESVVDVLDHLLNKGVLLNGDVTMGVAGVDLIYLRLSALLCAADRLLPVGSYRRPPSRRARQRVRGSRRR